MPENCFEDENAGAGADDWLLIEDSRAILAPFGGEGGVGDIEGCDRGEVAREEGFGGDRRSYEDIRGLSL